MRQPDRVFTAYALPLPPRRQGPAALLSLLAHFGIAVAVLWRGAALLDGGGGGAGPRGGGGGGQPAISWFALPAPSSPQALDVPPAPAVSVPQVALPLPQVERIDVTPVVVPLPPPSAATAAAPVAAGDGTTGGAGAGPGSGGGQGSGTGTGRGTDAGPGSGGEAGYISAATPRWSLLPPPGAPRQDRGQHEVRFWVTAAGQVTRVEVRPPIRDASYRREFMQKMMGFVFDPARTRDGRPVESIASVTITF